VLCHVTSLPDFSLEGCKKFLDWMRKNNFSIWQMLPINPPDQYSSPYSSTSAFAGWGEIIFSNEEEELVSEDYWIKDWALYCAIKDGQNGLPWYEWPEKLRDRDANELKKWEQKSLRYIREQKMFQNSWNKLKNLAYDSDIELFGDLPIFVAHDSADVWANRDLFQLDKNGMPKYVSGVPPDYFSEFGQKWGTVLYDWKAHEEDGWRWWRERIERSLRLFDMIRIDHFRAIHSNWAVPVEDEDARNGHWQDGPKDDLLKQIIEVAGSNEKIIVEDLGIIPQEVVDLRKRNELRGMVVLHFGFEGDLSKNPNNPKNVQEDQICYIATHDNDTTIGWWNDATSEIIENVNKLKLKGETINQTMIRIAQSCRSNLIVIPMQDMLNLDSKSRMNIPGVPTGNWTWKFAWDQLI